jgi:23S rRNA U2552 (ribose-2'-O)-methylase RlmE/FtsJ
LKLTAKYKLTKLQANNVEKLFKKILPDFEQIIEIGFHRGAFSLWLHQNKLPNTKLICYDISFLAKEVDDKNINFRLGDSFSDVIIEEIKQLIQSPLKTLLLCDGGDKEREFNLYSSFLKQNDVIMCHDFAESSEDYAIIKNGLNWPSPAESNLVNIKNAIDINDLAEFNYTDFKNVLWGSFIKK